MDFGLETGQQRPHRFHLRRLRVQLRHDPALLRQGREGVFVFENLARCDVALRSAASRRLAEVVEVRAAEDVK